MTWAQRLKRVFAIEIEKRGGKVKIIASIENPDVIEKILKHLSLDEAPQERNRLPPSKGRLYFCSLEEMWFIRTIPLN